MGDIHIRIPNAHPVLGRLGDGVDLGMNRPVAVLLDLPVRSARLIDQTADLGTVGQARRRAVIAGSQNAAFAYDHRPDLGPETRRALRNLTGDVEKVVIPRQPLAHGRYTNRSPADRGRPGPAVSATASVMEEPLWLSRLGCATW